MRQQQLRLQTQKQQRQVEQVLYWERVVDLQLRVPCPQQRVENEEQEKANSEDPAYRLALPSFPEQALDQH